MIPGIRIDQLFKIRVMLRDRIVDFRRYISAAFEIFWCTQGFGCLLVVIAGTIICASPLLSLSESSSYELFSVHTSESSAIRSSLHSRQLVTSLLVAIIISSPLFLESIVDGFTNLSSAGLHRYLTCLVGGGAADGNPSNFSLRHWGIRVGLLAALIIPHIIFLALEQESMGNQMSELELAHFFLCSFYFRGIATVGLLLTFVSEREADNLESNWLCITTLCTYTLGQILRLNAVDIRVGSSSSHISIASSFFILLALIQLCFLAVSWIYRGVVMPYIETQSLRYLKSTEMATSVYLGALLLMAIGSFAIEVHGVGIKGSLLNASPECLAALIYLQVVFTVLIVVMPQYAIRRDLMDAHTQIEGKKTFFQYISHEIRTPLNTVTMGLACMRDDIDELAETLRPESVGAHEAVRTMCETLEDVESSCQAALTILNELLMSDKMESGKLTLEADHCAPYPTFLETIRPFYLQARSKNVSLTLECIGRDMRGETIADVRVQNDLDKYFVYVDRNKIAQVMRNLISNALKFTPEGRSVKVVMKRISSSPTGGVVDGSSSSSMPGGGGGGVLLSAGLPVRIMPEELHLASSNRSIASTDDNSLLRIEVIDQGAGISANNQKNLFKKYAQFDAAKLQKGGGTGLGLWISRGIVELHGGCIGAFSEGEGKGCTFFLELPLVARKVIETPCYGNSRQGSGIQSPMRRFMSAVVMPTIRRPAGVDSRADSGGGGGSRSPRPAGSFMSGSGIITPGISPQGMQQSRAAAAAAAAAAALHAPDVSFRNLAHHVFDRNSMAIGSAMVSGMHTPQQRRGGGGGGGGAMEKLLLQQVSATSGGLALTSGGFRSSFGLASETSLRVPVGGPRRTTDVKSALMSPARGTSRKNKALGSSSPVLMTNADLVDLDGSGGHNNYSNNNNNNNYATSSNSYYRGYHQELRGDISKSTSSGGGGGGGGGGGNNPLQSNPMSNKNSNKSSFDRWSITPSPGQQPPLKVGRSLVVFNQATGSEDDSGSFRDANGINLQRHSRMTSFNGKGTSFSRTLVPNNGGVSGIDLTGTGGGGGGGGGSTGGNTPVAVGAGGTGTSVGGNTPGANDSWAAHISTPETADAEQPTGILSMMLQRHSRAPSGSRFNRTQQTQQQQSQARGGGGGGGPPGDAARTHSEDAAITPVPEGNYLRNPEAVVASLAVQRQFRSSGNADLEFFQRVHRFGSVLSDISEGCSRESTTHITPNSMFHSPRVMSAVASTNKIVAAGVGVGGVSGGGGGGVSGGGSLSAERQRSFRGKAERAGSISISGSMPTLAEEEVMKNTTAAMFTSYGNTAMSTNACTSSERTSGPPATKGKKEDGSSSLTILIVDDSTSNRKMVRRLLRNIASDMLEASDGQECLSVMLEASRLGTSVDIILMDDHMPILSGPETAKILRERGYSGLICGVTGNTLPSDIKNFKDHGASCVLSKPLNIDLLKYYISQYQVEETIEPQATA